MGAIAGIVLPENLHIDGLVDKMLNALKHRGCGKQDIHHFQNVALGMCSEKTNEPQDHGIFVTLDGTIFNANDLRIELQDQGFEFRTGTTEELIARAYEAWGIKFIERCDGHFAIGLLDEMQKKLYLIRDRIGRTPLYWYYHQRLFIFGSELKALLATGLIPQTPANDGIASYLFFGYVPQDMTPIQHVNKLLPGHYLEFNLGQRQGLSIANYWSYSSYFTSSTQDSKEAVVAKIDQLLTSATQLRIPKDKSIGCFVSGGLGSASIAYYVTKLCSINQPTAFTVGFENQNELDVQAAETIAKTLGISQKEDHISPDNFLDDLVKIAWYLDEPLADPTAISTWRLSQLAAQDVKVVFSGMGSDELLAGHNRYTIEEQKNPWLQRLLFHPSVTSVLIPILSKVYKPLAYKLTKHALSAPWQVQYLHCNALFSTSVLQEAAPGISQAFDPLVFLNKFHNLNRITSPVASYMYFDVKTRLADCFVMQYDRLTAANGLNWRAPYLDRHLLEYLASLPEPERLKEKETAQFLKTLLKKIFPSSVVDRPKRTRKDFLRSWVEKPELQALFKSLEKGTLVDTGVISEQWLSEQNRSMSTQSQAFPQLWAILMLEIWFKLFINQPVGQEPPKVSVRDLLA